MGTHGYQIPYLGSDSERSESKQPATDLPTDVLNFLLGIGSALSRLFSPDVVVLPVVVAVVAAGSDQVSLQVHCGKYLNSTPTSLNDLTDYIEDLIVTNFVK